MAYLECDIYQATVLRTGAVTVVPGLTATPERMSGATAFRYIDLEHDPRLEDSRTSDNVGLSGIELASDHPPHEDTLFDLIWRGRINKAGLRVAPDVSSETSRVLYAPSETSLAQAALVAIINSQSNSQSETERPFTHGYNAYNLGSYDTVKGGEPAVAGAAIILDGGWVNVLTRKPNHEKAVKALLYRAGVGVMVIDNPSEGELPNDPDGGGDWSGDREPRLPVTPTRSAAAELDMPA